MDQGNQLLVDLAGQHHLDHFCGIIIGVPKAIDESGLQGEFFHHLIDFRAAPVDQHHFDSHDVEQDHIPHHGHLKPLIHHGVAPVLDDNNFVVEFLNVGQGLD